ncbi:hypothetical protein [Ruminiclostridium papyrosolvens]|uniref:Uncharacterized protein n=1 Tax=Ruminiclostridium papyrosolvens C7 TaxID=1330534 RepID=U4R1A1_9FIRM|nr:hypothetical protein [Ruminiclostridium papyrosolvens]EPR10553.1 hypothetical protein L323_13430 [Ruminiclostridium papyrosolvens C7]
MKIRWHLSGTQWGGEYEIVSILVAIAVNQEGYRGYWSQRE